MELSDAASEVHEPYVSDAEDSVFYLSKNV